MEMVVFWGLFAPFLGTTLGAAGVFFLKKGLGDRMQRGLTGFAAGVMVAASVWSLLIPAMEQSAGAGQWAFLPAVIGFWAGIVFLLGLDHLIPHLHQKSRQAEGLPAKLRRSTMMVLAVTLHNIPEGLAVGVAFGALQGSDYTAENLMGAISVAVGIGLQNFPEGAAVSVPLRREGYSRKKSFLIGQASGLVEPIAGVIGALLVVYVEAILPYALSFAAGAMILVAVHELIPECQRNQKTQPYFATMGIVLGFAVMMLLDVMLG